MASCIGFIGGFVSYIGFIGNIGTLHPLKLARHRYGNFGEVAAEVYWSQGKVALQFILRA